MRLTGRIFAGIAHGVVARFFSAGILASTTTFNTYVAPRLRPSAMPLCPTYCTYGTYGTYRIDCIDCIDRIGGISTHNCCSKLCSTW
jgi:hypothetical protein